MKFLVAGIHTHLNQFTRAIDSYEGCEWIHQDGDPGGHVPHDVDAAILVTSHMSHAKFYEVKKIMKERGKAFWIVDRSFSELAERFETFLRENNHPVVRKGQSVNQNTAMAAALRDALEKEKQQTEKVEELPVQKAEKRLTMEEAFVIMTDLEKQGITSANDLVAYFKENNYKTTTGIAWDKGRVYSTLSIHRKKFGIKGPDSKYHTAAHKAKQAESEEAAPVHSSTKGLSAARQLELIIKINSSNLASTRKSELIEEVTAGVRTVEHQVIAERKGEHLQITMQSIFEQEDKPLVMLDKIMAVGILKVLAEIRDFVNE